MSELATAIPTPPTAPLITFGQEGGHWYDRQGNPAYTIVGKNGKERPTTLRDARSLGLGPSVTTVMRAAAAPGLDNWKRQQLLLASVTLPRHPGETLDDFVQRVIEDADQHALVARETGVAIHDSIDSAFADLPYPVQYTDHVNGTINAVSKFMGDLDGVRCEHSFYHPLGYGGKCDIHKPLERDDLVGAGFVADYKTKEFTEDKLPKLYDDHPMQLAAYRHGLNMPNARCAIVFVSVNVPGLTHTVEATEEELQRGWQMFSTLLSFWKLKNKYDPSISN